MTAAAIEILPMACLALWFLGFICVWLSGQLDDDIPAIALLFGAAVFLLGGLVMTPANVQMGAEAIAVVMLLWTGRRRLELDSQ